MSGWAGCRLKAVCQHHGARLRKPACPTPSHSTVASITARPRRAAVCSTDAMRNRPRMRLPDGGVVPGTVSDLCAELDDMCWPAEAPRTASGRRATGWRKPCATVAPNGPCTIRSDPLPVVGRRREGVDPLLRGFAPLRWTELARRRVSGESLRDCSGQPRNPCKRELFPPSSSRLSYRPGGHARPGHAATRIGRYTARGFSPQIVAEL